MENKMYKKVIYNIDRIKYEALKSFLHKTLEHLHHLEDFIKKHKKVKDFGRTLIKRNIYFLKLEITKNYYTQIDQIKHIIKNELPIFDNKLKKIINDINDIIEEIQKEQQLINKYKAKNENFIDYINFLQELRESNI